MKMVKEFYDFVYERESIRLRREASLPRSEWTSDEILKTYKFTNVKREHDRTTRELMEHFYWKVQSPVSAEVLLLNCTMARFFGLAGTVLEIGWQPTWNQFQRDQVQVIVEARIKRRDKVFTSAYIVPNCGDTDPKHHVVLRIMNEVWGFAETYFKLHSLDDGWKQLIDKMCACVRGMGSFMAKEVVLDFVLASNWTPRDWLTWTPIGPGARRGAARVYYGGAIERLPTEKVALEWTLQLYEARTEHWSLPSVITPDGVISSNITLELSDIQFQLCEFDKYMRAKTGDGRPKALFKPTS